MIPGNYLINDIKYFINSKGFRGDNFKKENKNNCRIISLGGSITFGVEESYPKELEKLINKNISKKCESLNFGITSKGLNYVENLFNNEVIEYSPNIVTIMANRNSTMYDSYGSGSKSPGIISNKKEFYYYKIHSFLFSNIMTYRFIDLVTKRLIFISTSDDGKIANYVQKGGANFNNPKTTTSSWTQNTWYNITITGDSGAVSGRFRDRIYVNGTLENSFSIEDNNFMSATSGSSTQGDSGAGTYGGFMGNQVGFYLGSYGSGSYFPGQIGPLLIYDRELSSTEVTQVYDAYKSRFGY